jgi:L-threonylcarbamoyladenylate synthase
MLDGCVVLKDRIKQAVKTLQEGGLVAIPTETVYGLAADASNPEAIKKIFQVKGRPIDHPLIVHIAHVSQLHEWAIDISDKAMLLAEAFWPGPLTLILKKAPGVSLMITGGQDTIGVRIPRHPVAQALLMAFGRAVVAPSANRFGRISPTTAVAVQEELGDQVGCILDGGQCEVGVESTIVDVSGEVLQMLRPGMITAQQIETVLHEHLSMQKNNVPRVSGALDSHYAPVTPVRLVESTQLSNVLSSLSDEQLPVAVMTYSFAFDQKGVLCRVMSADPVSYAHDLYQVLRELDHQRVKQMLVEAVPNVPEWSAIADRLQRASHLF